MFNLVILRVRRGECIKGCHSRRYFAVNELLPFFSMPSIQIRSMKKTLTSLLLSFITLTLSAQTLLKDIAPNNSSMSFGGTETFLSFQNDIYFKADSTGNNVQIYKYKAGEVTQVAKGSWIDKVEYNNELYFTENNYNFTEKENYIHLYSFDGQRTRRHIIDPVDSNSKCYIYGVVNNQLIFDITHLDGNASGLFSYDGTSISRLPMYARNMNIAPAMYATEMYYTSRGTSSNLSLFKYDGTDTIRISALDLPNTRELRVLCQTDDAFYVGRGENGTTYELWKYSLTTNTINKIATANTPWNPYFFITNDQGKTYWLMTQNTTKRTILSERNGVIDTVMSSSVLDFNLAEKSSFYGMDKCVVLLPTAGKFLFSRAITGSTQDDIYSLDISTGAIDTVYKGLVNLPLIKADNEQIVFSGGDRSNPELITIKDNKPYSLADTAMRWGNHFWNIAVFGDTVFFSNIAFNTTPEVGYEPYKIALEPNIQTNSLRPMDPDLFTVYPNPAANTLTISTQVQQIKNMSILDMSGKQLKIYPSTDPTLDISGLQSGMYILQLNTADGIAHTRFIKK